MLLCFWIILEHFFAASIPAVNAVSAKPIAKSPRNLPDCIISEIFISDNSLLPTELFANPLENFTIYILRVYNFTILSQIVVKNPKEFLSLRPI